jgi:hypothetical protein
MFPIKDAILILKTGKQKFSGEFLFNTDPTAGW